MEKSVKESKNYKKSIAIIILLSIASVLLLVYLTNKQEDKKDNKDFVAMNTDRTIYIEDDYILTNYPEYEILFGDDKLTEENFEKNNYLVLKINYNPCHQDDVLPTDYKIKGSKVDVTVKYQVKCGLCAPDTLYYLLKIDKDITKLKSNIKYEAINEVNCPQDIDYRK